MPDIWTQHPDIVRDLLKEAGFTCGVEGRFLKGRDPEWTCIFDGKTMYGDLYIHHASQLRSEAPAGSRPDYAAAAEWGAPALAVALVLAVAIRRPRRNRQGKRPDG